MKTSHYFCCFFVQGACFSAWGEGINFRVYFIWVCYIFHNSQKTSLNGKDADPKRVFFPKLNAFIYLKRIIDATSCIDTICYFEDFLKILPTKNFSSPSLLQTSQNTSSCFSKLPFLRLSASLLFYAGLESRQVVPKI